jgi:hypothetical protein
MTAVINYLQTYYREQFSWKHLLIALLMATALCIAEYQYDVYKHYVVGHDAGIYKILSYTVMYCLAFWGTWLLQQLVKKDSIVWDPKAFIWPTLFIILFAIRGISNTFSFWLPNHLSYPTYAYAYKLAYNLGGILFIILPALILRKAIDSSNDSFFGFKRKGISLTPYWVMIAVMIPILFFASQDASFQTMYPRFLYTGIDESHPSFLKYIISYELSYATDFVATEFLFRGLLIIGMTRYFGPSVILPMAVWYVTIHFGKPLGETISSFFGGWLLGIIAYYSKSIYGGIIVHLGIALLMEMFGALAHYLY